ncbi:unnamed protein product [Amoebophrya sp. A25]|nr:unnamed protein product [Amoebophrya sp. A25]|eukprot:GSA25T00007470001.1
MAAIPQKRISVTPATATTNAVPVTFTDLSYEVDVPKSETYPSGKLQILDKMTGCFRPGRLTALMGPSGSGKTTLMDLLAMRKTLEKGKSRITSGKILYGGQEMTKDSLHMVAGYVEQFDTFAGELTVEQMLLYTAELKLPKSWTDEKIRELVASVIKKLSLQSCKDTKIGSVLERGISGGQAKRCNIALALITKPAVLYLDEPTSGLDSYTANEVVLLLKALASEGRTIVCTIHSPTAFAFSLFDDLVMMRDGKLLYAGELRLARNYFASISGVEGGAFVTGAPPCSGQKEHVILESEGGLHGPVVSDEIKLAAQPAQVPTPHDDVLAGTRQYSKTSGFSTQAFDQGLFSLPEWLVDITSGKPSQTVMSNLAVDNLFHEQQRSDSKESTGGQRGQVGVENKEHTLDTTGEHENRRDFLFDAFQKSPQYQEWLLLVQQCDAESVRDPTTSGISQIAKAYDPRSSFSKLRTILKYRAAQHYRDGEYLGPRVGDKVFMALVIVSLYWDIGDKTDAQSILSTSAMLYFVCAICGYGAAAYVPSLTLDRPLFYRELADGCFGPFTYYASKFLEESTLCIFTSVFFVLTVSWAVNLTGNVLVFILLYYVTAMLGIVLAYLFAAVSPNMDVANALLPTYVTLCMYFGGLFIVFSKIGAGWYWFSWISFLRYAWGAMMVNNYADADGPNEPGGQRVLFQEGVPLTVLEFYELEGDVMGNEWIQLLLLAVQLVFFSTLGAYTLKYVRHGSR